MDRIGAHESSPHRGASEWVYSSLDPDSGCGEDLRVVAEANGETVHHAFFDCRSGLESQEGVGTWLFNTIQTRICCTSNFPTG
jgi:hypothetical protein